MPSGWWPTNPNPLRWWHEHWRHRTGSFARRDSAGTDEAALTTMRLLALGDSYTIGEGVAPADAWPQGLARALTGDVTAMPTVVATTGWTTDELLAALETTDLDPPYDLVTVLIGVNDHYRGREVDEHLPHFNRLLSQAVSFADGDPDRVRVVSIPDWGATPFAASDARSAEDIATQIDAYNAAQRELCEGRGIVWIDITDLTRELAAKPGMFVDDGLHPSAAQYARWLAVVSQSSR